MTTQQMIEERAKKLYCLMHQTFWEPQDDFVKYQYSKLAKYTLSLEIKSRLDELGRWGSFSQTPLVQGRINTLTLQLQELDK